MWHAWWIWWLKSSRSESADDIEIDCSQNQNEFVARDGSQCKECGSETTNGRLATQNILNENSGPTSFARNMMTVFWVLSCFL